MLTWDDLTSRPRPACDATIVYGEDAMHRIDLWRPAGDGPHPVVLMVHGGCWQTAIADRRLMDWAADDLRAAGFAVWNIDYRGVDRPGGGYPGTFRDVAAATDHLRASAAEWRLDTSRLVAVGHSAGGHLALWLAARGRIPAASALFTADALGVPEVIALGALPDLEAVAASPDNGCGTAVIDRLIGTDRANRFTDTSIPPLLPLGVRQQLVNGREDRIIPYRFATDYSAAAEAAGDAVALHTVPATGHVELITPGTAAWTMARRLVAAALSRDSSGG
ncbi:MULTISPECIES: alpha/beta hydrolase [Sphingomonas]|jgi:acetyl esterase/lipase|uniref:alpha/beta hydrolase n=1 Tax=Sphingomonas TaxID=13687 RepID=UPI001AED1715|nr:MULTISPECIES: alpha/beta hydrolase [Sphingomonas]